MNKQKALNMLGLAMRAGKLISGEELTIKEIRSGKAQLVLVACDASENTRKKISDKSSHYQVPLVTELNHDELSQAIGRPRMVIAVTDRGFAERIHELMTN